MLSKLISKNSQRDRRNNRLYYSSMIISVVAFYVILSLSHQDVMRFLMKIEGRVVKNFINQIIPVFYCATLAILFFLVYFASRIQLENRQHEFGVYLTLGMRRSKLFTMLLLEDLKNNCIVIAIGLPLSVFISELVSLITAKFVGLDIIRHRFSLSLMAIIFTIFGFMLVKSVAYVFLSTQMASKEIGALLKYSPVGAKRKLPIVIYLLVFVLGIAFLSTAYYLGIKKGIDNMENLVFIVLSGSVGTILLFWGMRPVIGIIACCGSAKKLHTYNFRQIQELVINRSTTLAICSLLFFIVMSLLGVAVSLISINYEIDEHSLDYTFIDTKDQLTDKSAIEEVRKELAAVNLDSEINLVAIKTSSILENQHVSFPQLEQSLKSQQNDTQEGENIVYHVFHDYVTYNVISLSSFNDLLRLVNRQELRLKTDEVCLYMRNDLLSTIENDKSAKNLMQQKLDTVKIGDDEFKISDKIQSLPLSSDGSLAFSLSLIMPDEVFNKYTEGKYNTYVGGALRADIVENKGLMTAISDTNEKLDKTQLVYKSYLQTVGRKLFGFVAIIYITIYLVVILLIVANTIISVQFLLNQKRSYKRYQTLIYLGATYDTLCRSFAKQINWYFGLPIFVAVINCFFGLLTVFKFMMAQSDANSASVCRNIVVLEIVLMGTVEAIYMFIVKKSSNKYILSLLEPQRDDE